MNPERWQEIKVALHRVLELQGASRLAYIDEITANDAELRSELVSLIAAHEGSAESFLNIPAAVLDAGAETAYLQADSRIGNYRLVCEIGHGGMGQVWLAEQMAPVRRLVALKLIRAGMYDETVAHRFQAERQSLAIMDHPAIAKVFDAGATLQGQPYFVMEYVPGLPITDYCDQKRLKIRDRLELFIQACEGVQHAHQKAIIHRDLKPANILIVEVDGKALPRIIDFGLAKTTTPQPADETLFTQYGQFIGTPGFMSPEQINPEIRDIDTRTDVYSLGVILYVLLAGQQPFETKGQRLPLDRWLHQLREEEPPTLGAKVSEDRQIAAASAAARSTDPKQLVNELRGDLEWITRKALRREREQRYGTPSELAADVRHHLNHEPVMARPASTAYQIGKFVRRHRAGIATTSVLVLTLAGGLAATSYEAKVASTQRDLSVQAQMRALTQTAAGRLRDADVPGALGLILEVLPHQGAARSYTPEALSVFHEARAADPQVLAIAGHQQPVLSAAFSPDGLRIATASADKSARIWDVATGQELVRLLAHEGQVNSVRFSSDGLRLVTASHDKSARIWDAATGRQIVALIGHTDRVWFAAFSPDGRRVVTASYDKTARIWDAATGRQIRVFTGHTDAVHSAAFSPDGQSIVTASYDRTVRIWDAASGRQVMQFSGHADVVLFAAFSPDGRRVVTSAIDNTARIWDVDSGRQLLVLSGHTSWLPTAVFSPDGSRILTASYDNTARIWDAATGRQILRLSGHLGWVASAAFAPDGNRVVTASHDKTARIWDIAIPNQIRVLSGHTSFVSDAKFSPDDRRIVTASNDKTARIWDTSTGQEVQQLSGHTDMLNSVEFSPDGARVLSDSNDKTARIWDAATGRQLQLVGEHTKFVNTSSFSPDGRRVVTASADNVARIWDAATNRQLQIFTGHTNTVFSAVFSPDASRILTSSWDNTARIWDAATGRQIVQLNGHTDRVNFAAFSPDGTRVVTASADNTARIWDAATGRQLLILSGHTDTLGTAVFSSDGKRVVTSSHDGSARIWDAVTGRQLLLLRGHTSMLESAAFSHDGWRVVTASDDKTARIWDARPVALEAQIEWAEAAQFDPLSSTERFQAGLPAATDVRQWGLEGSKCDESAAAPYDPKRRAPGVTLDRIESDAAVAACADSPSMSDSKTRFLYQHARALMGAGKFAAARQEMEQAVASGYQSARVELAMLLSEPKAAMLDVPRAILLYEQAWNDGLTIAAFELGKLYEEGVRPASGTTPYLFPPDNAEAWAWYRKAADAAEPHALARFADGDTRAASLEAHPQKKQAYLLESFKYYAAASLQAQIDGWPAGDWRNWRYHRASLARVLARDGMMQQVADAYSSILAKGSGHPQSWWQRIAAKLHQ